MVYNRGKGADVLTWGTPREEVVKKWGSPLPAEAEIFFLRGKKPSYDEYHMRGSIFDFMLASGACMSSGMTLGLLGIVNFPAALYWYAPNWGMKRGMNSYDGEQKLAGVMISEN